MATATVMVTMLVAIPATIPIIATTGEKTTMAFTEWTRSAPKISRGILDMAGTEATIAIRIIDTIGTNIIFIIHYTSTVPGTTIRTRIIAVTIATIGSRHRLVRFVP